MPVPLVALGTCGASVAVAGVHDNYVLVVFVAMVPLALPNVQLTVCVNEVDARVIVIVPAVPIVKVLNDSVDARGMSVNVTLPDAAPTM